MNILMALRIPIKEFFKFFYIIIGYFEFITVVIVVFLKRTRVLLNLSSSISPSPKLRIIISISQISGAYSAHQLSCLSIGKSYQKGYKIYICVINISKKHIDNMTYIVYNKIIDGGIIMKNAMNRIGKNIKALREQSGFTQISIAKYLNVDQSLISKIEKNERSITSDMLERLSALFGVPVESFNQESIPTNQISFALRASVLNEDDLEIISAINRIALNLNFMNGLLEGYEIGR